MKFRFTVRDNSPMGGSSASDDTVITVSGAAGPFVVSSPNTNLSWEVDSNQTITWNVAGTTANGINAANVDILLSTDGGNTYPITIMSAVANDGSQNINVPNEVGTQNRIMVRGSGHIFYDISNTNFSIIPSVDSQAPTAHTNLTASNITETTVDLSWDASTDNIEVTEYDIYQGSTVIGTETNTSFQATGLTPATMYNFSVKAKDAAENESTSTAINVTTLLSNTITQITAPNSVEINSTVTVNVDYSSAETNDIVVWFQRDNNPFTVYKSVRTTVPEGSGTLNVSIAIPGSVPVVADDYQFQAFIAAVGGSYNDRYDNLSQTNISVVATTDTEAPTAITDLESSNINSTVFNISWVAATDNVGVTEYEVYIDGVLDGTTNSATTAYSFTELTPNTSYNVSVVALDAAENESSLTTISVSTPPITNQSLKSLADAKGKYIGNLMRDGFFDDHQVFNGATDLIAKTEYNTLVLGNKMKMSNLLNNRPVDPFNVKISDINTANIDRFVAYADANGMRKRGHVMIWYNQIPMWLQNEVSTWSAQQVYDFSKSYILALSAYTAGKIDEWDVLNEAVLSNGYRTNTWYDIVNTQANDNGEIGYIEYFTNLFKWARQGDPNAPLFYNDYNVEPIGTSKNNFMRSMVKDMKNIHGAPIDGVGLQSHFTLTQMNNSFINQVGQTIDDLGLSGFTVNLTELDIRICNGDGTTLEDQRIAYRNIVSTALSRNNCNTVLIWGMSDNDSWIPGLDPNCGQATLHDDFFQKKPAYFGVQEALSNLVIIEGINTVTGPEIVASESTVEVSVNYTATESRDVVVLFQRDNSPFTTYDTVITTVSAGTNTITVPVSIDNTIPIAIDEYKYVAYIAPIGGNWNDRIDNIGQINVSVISEDTDPPSTVSNLESFNIAQNSFNLSWDDSTDDFSYIEYAISVDGVLHGNTNSTSYAISGLSLETTYSISVVAIDGSENESTPSTINVTTLPLDTIITQITAPNSVEINSTVTVEVDYSSSESNDIVVWFQRDNTPFSLYESIRTTVPQGIGSINVSLTIPGSVPVVADDYQFQAFIAAVGYSTPNS